MDKAHLRRLNPGGLARFRATAVSSFWNSQRGSWAIHAFFCSRDPGRGLCPVPGGRWLDPS